MKFSTALAPMVASSLLLVCSGIAAAQPAYPSKAIRIIIPFAEGGVPGLVSRRPVRGQGAHAAGFVTVALSTAQSYPSKPIRFIVPFAPGGTNDILARLLGPRLTESWGQPVVVDNRPGGNTVIASDALLKSAPDGHTVLLVGNSHVLVPLLSQTALPFDSIKDFAPVASIARTGLFLVIHPSIPASNLRGFIALAKSRPGELNCASPGGSVNQLAMEVFNSMAGVKIQHIPYKGSGPAVSDVIGGQAHLAFQTPIVVLPHVRSGRLKALAISGETPFPDPRVPTFGQAGLPGFDVGLSFGLLAPAGTPGT